MPIVHMNYLPHGNIILDPQNKYPVMKEDTQASHDSMLQAAKLVASHKPDLVILTFPHGTASNQDFTVYTKAPFSSGTAEWLGEWTDFRVRVPVDVKATDVLCDEAEAKGFGIARLVTAGGAPGAEHFMRWSEVVPIWFLEEELGGKVPYILIQKPLVATMTDPVSKKDTLLEFGNFLYDLCTTGALASRRIVLAVSGDQAHTLKPKYSGLELGLPGASDSVGLEGVDDSQATPFGVHPHGAMFDAAMRKWFGTLDPKDFEDSYQYMKSAIACGAAGLMSLQRIVERFKADGKKVNCEVLADIAPTYYGMVTAVFNVGP
ncbi:hypothetical protein DFJ74DRAFT_767375 [Hyaloraphidium curvatum]|nr:hypothetical protein DFJ74DRAFT_767375 [Hyaloraphidium curvatum]